MARLMSMVVLTTVESSRASALNNHHSHNYNNRHCAVPEPDANSRFIVMEHNGIVMRRRQIWTNNAIRNNL
jgi:hypothetical protein